VLRLADDVNGSLRPKRVSQIDIGGGLPTAYRDGDPSPAPAEYAAMLRREAPGIFDPRLRIVTEFGRAIQGGCGFAASRVEYVKGEPPTVAIHFGADLFLREVYHAADWHHEMFVLDPKGDRKPGPARPTTVAGPLCFSGDVVARDRALSAIEPGDWLVIQDAGAYTLSMWSRHCSRGMPLVLGHDDDRFRLLRKAESAADVVRFWSRDVV